MKTLPSPSVKLHPLQADKLQTLQAEMLGNSNEVIYNDEGYITYAAKHLGLESLLQVFS